MTDEAEDGKAREKECMPVYTDMLMRGASMRDMLIVKMEPYKAAGLPFGEGTPLLFAATADPHEVNKVRQSSRIIGARVSIVKAFLEAARETGLPILTAAIKDQLEALEAVAGQENWRNYTEPYIEQAIAKARGLAV